MSSKLGGLGKILSSWTLGSTSVKWGWYTTTAVRGGTLLSVSDRKSYSNGLKKKEINSNI